MGKPVKMKNITVSVGDSVYHRARLRAAEQRTSVSAIVRKHLEEIAAEETEHERLRRQETEMLQQIAQRRTGFSASQRSSRDELHDRHAFS